MLKEARKLEEDN